MAYYWSGDSESSDSEDYDIKTVKVRSHSHQVYPLDCGYTRREMRKLKRKAAKFVKGKLTGVCEQFFRNKSADYFQDILDTTGIMNPLRKDQGGDPRNPINGRLEGVFLSARDNPPSKSPFGRKRILIDADELFDRDCCLFFSDFYCVNDPHYIQLVLTPGHCVDDYPILTDELVELDITDNPFLWIDEDDDVIVVTGYDVWVEVFYTECIDIEDLIDRGAADLVTTGIIGTGSSTDVGVRKDTDCPDCNL